ncbi:hypothetical protein CCR95_21005 [Thiocystis minor]|uniref:hypothetical protein n=1 Tax=Thiocystis minor TaxID=61597 RepID=UPI00191350EA|nr:hypothetical protein [Thiocystis minor]MBK5966484.1 hypothetical protein [Thiocystis minor]
MNKQLLVAAASAALLSMGSNAYAQQGEDIFHTAHLPAVPGAEIQCTVVNADSSFEGVTAELFKVNNDGTSATVKKSAYTALVEGEGFKITHTHNGAKQNFYCVFTGDGDPDVAAAIVIQKGTEQNSETAEQRDGNP